MLRLGWVELVIVLHARIFTDVHLLWGTCLVKKGAVKVRAKVVIFVCAAHCTKSLYIQSISKWKHLGIKAAESNKPLPKIRAEDWNVAQSISADQHGLSLDCKCQVSFAISTHFLPPSLPSPRDSTISAVNVWWKTTPTLPCGILYQENFNLL